MALWISVSIASLIIFSMILIQIPFIQTFIAHRIADNLSEKLGVEVSIGKVSLSILLNVSFSDLSIKDKHQHNLISVDEAYAFVSDISFRNKNIKFSKITLICPDIYLRKYQNDSTYNYQFLVDYFSSPSTTETKNPWTFSFTHFDLLRGKFQYLNDNFKSSDNNTLDFNNLKLSNFNLSLSDFTSKNDSIQVSLSNFSVYDSSGFYLKNLQSVISLTKNEIHLKNTNVSTFRSNLFFDLRCNFDSLSDFNDFTNKVSLNLSLFTSKINSQDIAYFVPNLGKFNNSFTLSMNAKGKIKRLVAKDIKLKYRSETSLLANLTINGLPNIQETFIDFNIKEFETSIDDIQKFNFPNNKKIALPFNLFKAKKINIKGIFTGFMNDFVANARFNTAAGTLITDVNLKTIGNTMKYSGKVASENLNPSLFISDLKDINAITFEAEINGSGNKLSNFDIEFDGTIKNVLLLNKTNISNIYLTGDLKNQYLTANISVDDPNLRISFDGNANLLKGSESYYFFSSVKSAKISNLNLTDRAKDCELKTQIWVDVKGTNLDNLTGDIKLQNFSYTENAQDYKINNLQINSSVDFLGMKNVQIISNWINIDIAGKFLLSDIGAIADNILQKYLPSLSNQNILASNIQSITDSKKIKANEKQTAPKQLKSENRYLSFDINVLDAKPITDLFLTNLIISNNTTISGFLNAQNKTINCNLDANYISMSGIEFTNFHFNTNTLTNLLKVSLKSEYIQLIKSDSIFLKNFVFQGNLINDSIQYSIGWNGSNNNIRKNQAEINGEAQLFSDKTFKTKIYESKIIINDSIWTLEAGNSLVFSKYEYQINKLLFTSNNKYILINGMLSSDPSKTLTVELKNVNISEADPLTELRQFDLDGILNGNIEIVDAFNKISLITNLKVKNLGLNAQKLGDAEIVSVWDHRKKGLFINAEIIFKGNVSENRPVAIQGYYYPSTDSLDLTADLLNFRLKAIEKYLSAVLYKLEGFASGKLNIFGTLRRPEMSGNIKLMRTSVGVKELNTEYTITHLITLESNRIVFNDVHVLDSEGNIGVLSGYVTHKDFQNIFIDLTIKANNLMALNTNQSMNELFYGKVFGTGIVEIKGPAENVIINAQITSDKNTEMFIPISYSTSVSEQSFIKFINPKDNKTNSVENITQNISGVQMNFLINVNPNARFTIFLDPSTGGTIKGTGEGTLRMEINTNGEFNMFGTYKVKEGEYLMTIKDVINKKFLIEDGGIIQWNGDPIDADINLKAIYKTRASIATLLGVDSTGTSSGTSSTSRRIPVNSELYLTGKLMNPNVSFGITLPSADNTTKTFFYNMLDTTNDQSMIRQTFSLLLFGRFESEKAQYGNMMGEGIGSSSLDMVTSQLSSLISQYSKGVDIGVNYRQGDDTYSEEIQVNMSTELFNERLIIDGNLGVGGQNVYQQNANQIVGDVKVEYKVTEDGKIRVKAFNQQNNNEFTNINAPYTQGLALVFRKDFNSFKEIFKRNKKKKKR